LALFKMNTCEGEVMKVALKSYEETR